MWERGLLLPVLFASSKIEASLIISCHTFVNGIIGFCVISSTKSLQHKILTGVNREYIVNGNSQICHN